MVHKDVAIIAFYKDNRILLQDRRDISKWGEEFGFFGGHMEEGESPEEAVVREIKEELCYDLKELVFLKKFSEKYKDFTHSHHVFIAPCPPLASFKQTEGQGMMFFSEEEALKLKMVTIDYDIIRHVFKFLRTRKNELRE